MNKVILTVIAIFMCILTGLADEYYSPKDIVSLILLQCHGPEDPTPDEELADYARVNGLSNAEVSKILVSFIEDGLRGEGNRSQHQLARASLWALARFGGEKEVDFVRSVMRTAEDSGIRRAAVLVGMRIAPEKWEEFIREVAANENDSLTRFVAYEEAVMIAMKGDDAEKRNVERVFSELAEIDGHRAERLRRWAAELKSAEKSAD